MTVTKRPLRVALRTDLSESVAHVCGDLADLLKPRRVRLLQSMSGDAWCTVNAGAFEAAFRDLLTDIIAACDYSQLLTVRVEGGTDAVRVDVTAPSPGPRVTHFVPRFEAIGARLRIFVYLGRSTTFRVIVPRQRGPRTEPLT